MHVASKKDDKKTPSKPQEKAPQQKTPQQKTPAGKPTKVILRCSEIVKTYSSGPSKISLLVF